MRCRPSELLGIEDTLVAYYLDKAVYLFGSAIDEDLEKAVKGAKNDKAIATKQQIVLNKWLRSEGGARYRDPAAPKG